MHLRAPSANVQVGPYNQHDLREEEEERRRLPCHVMRREEYRRGARPWSVDGGCAAHVLRV